MEDTLSDSSVSFCYTLLGNQVNFSINNEMGE